jgi:unsaturated chondroitin disaccharide hydrolase
MDRIRPAGPTFWRGWGRPVTVLVAFILTGVLALAATEDPFDVLIREDVVFAQHQLTRTLDSLATMPSRYPIYTDATGAWVTTSSSDWTPGFFPGSLWLMYQQTFDDTWKNQAEKWLVALDSRKSSGAMDLGFMIFNSFGNGYRLTGDDPHRQVVLTAARSLATRYHPTVGCIYRTSSSTDVEVIIDAMMNLELLFWASKHGGDQTGYDRAVSHALKTMEHHVRPDGSTYQVVDFDPQTGAVRRKRTRQGIDAETTWSRGQAWGIYGFTMTYRETDDQRFLETARRIADYYIAHLPPDRVPYWDFQAPTVLGPSEPRDTSAAAIAASGLLELARLELDPGRSAKYLSAATETIASLSSVAYLARGTSNAAILLHGTYHKLAGLYDTGLIWGDYYFLEALLRYRLIPSSRPAFPVTVDSASSDGGNAHNVLDDDLDTRWSPSDDNPWIVIDLGEPRTIEEVALAFSLGDQRASKFVIETSADAGTWSPVLRSLSSGQTVQPETFDVPDHTARYVRIAGFGDVFDAPNSITEVDILGGEAPPPPPDTTAPAVPTGLTATAGDGSVRLDWADNRESDLAGYQVYRQNADGTWPPSPLASPTSSAFTNLGLTNGTPYTYRVTARDTADNESRPSAEVSATPTRAPLTKHYRPSGYTATSGSVYRSRGALSRLYSNDASRVEITAARVGGIYVSEIEVSATISTAELATLRSLTVTEDGHVTTGSAALTLSLFNWDTGSWTVLDGPRTGVTSDRTLTLSPAGAAADYFSTSGETVGKVRLRVTGTRTSSSFRTATDWVRFTIGY